MSINDYYLLLDIFKQYEKLNFNKVLKKNDSCMSKPDCKGSNFRGLRNLTSDAVSSLLLEVQKKSLPLQKLNFKCQEVKKVNELKKKFTEYVGAETWEEAQQNFPEFAVEHKLKDKFCHYQKIHNLLLIIARKL